jgi:hypothetical protein
MLTPRNLLLLLLFDCLLGCVRLMGAIRLHFYARRRPTPSDLDVLARANSLTTAVLITGIGVTVLFAVSVGVAAS